MPQPYLKIAAIVLEPRTSTGLPTNAVYVDQASGALSNKGGTGAVAPIGAGAASADSVLTKVWHNKSGATMAAGIPVAKLTDGSMAPADAHTRVRCMAVLLEETLNNAQGRVALIGPNVIGALTGLGFAPGDAIYLSVSGGYTNNAAFAQTNTIVRIGFADCATGPASAVAQDLVMFAEVVSVL